MTKYNFIITCSCAHNIRNNRDKFCSLTDLNAIMCEPLFEESTDQKEKDSLA